MTPLRERMLEELRRRNFSPDTTRGYVHAVAQFAEYFHKSPELLGFEEIGQFQVHLLEEKKLALGTIALRMGALRFLALSRIATGPLVLLGFADEMVLPSGRAVGGPDAERPMSIVVSKGS